MPSSVEILEVLIKGILTIELDEIIIEQYEEKSVING